MAVHVDLRLETLVVSTAIETLHDDINTQRIAITMLCQYYDHHWVLYPISSSKKKDIQRSDCPLRYRITGRTKQDVICLVIDPSPP